MTESRDNDTFSYAAPDDPRLKRFVIRLKNAPSPSALVALNEDFADIIVEGKIEVIPPTPEETEDGDRLDLARIAFVFNRRDYGRVRQLIDVLNSF